MMKYLFTFLVVFTTLSLFSQPNLDNLNGRWDFYDIYQNELIDSTGIQMLESFFGDMMIQFNSDERYQAVIFGRPDQGVWSAKDENTLLLRSNEGTITTIKIISLTDSEFIFKLQRGEFIMKKTAKPEPVKAANTKLPFKTVSATTSEIARRWNLEKKDYNKELTGDAEEIAKNIEGSIYMVFSKNGRFESQLLGIKEKGNWAFENNNQTIVTNIDGQGKVWNIISISDSELVLIQGDKPEKWYFQVEN